MTSILEDCPTLEDHRTDRSLLRGYLHKTSNSLCGIKGYASLLADPSRHEGDSGRWAQKILAEIEKLEEIFRSVGTLTPDRGHPDIGIDMPGLIGDICRTAAGHHGNLDIRLGDLPDGEILLPVADLRLVLTELLANCAECLEGPAGRVAVTIEGRRGPSGRIELMITDDGPGLEGTLSNRAADPFITTKEGHLGIGLTRVATLMEMYGLAWHLFTPSPNGTTVALEIAESTE